MQVATACVFLSYADSHPQWLTIFISFLFDGCSIVLFYFVSPFHDLFCQFEGVVNEVRADGPRTSQKVLRRHPVNASSTPLKTHKIHAPCQCYVMSCEHVPVIDSPLSFCFPGG